MDRRILLIILLFFSYFFLIGLFNFFSFGVVNGGQDFFFHFSAINGDTSLNPDYPFFYHFLFSYFGFSQIVFYLVNVFVIAVLIPLLVFKLTKTFWGVVFYFCGVSLPHIWLFGATYPQALVFVFLLVYFLNRKNVVVFGLMGFLSVLTHASGFGLFVLVGVFEIISYFVRFFVFEKYEKGVLKKIKYFYLIFPAKINNLVMLVFFLFAHNSVIVLYYAFKSLKLFYLGLAFVSVWLSQTDFRIASLAQICFLISASGEITKLSKKKKFFIVVLLFVQLAYFVLDFGVGTVKIAYLGGSF